MIIIFRKLVLLTALLPTLVFGQIISNKDAALYKGTSAFNSKFIKENGIRKITGTIAIKRVLQPIEATGEIVEYLFDNEGLLVEKIKTNYNHQGVKDSNSVLYYYDDIHQLINEVSTHQSGFNALKFNYDEKGNLSAMEQWKGENLSDAMYQLKKGRPFKLSEERYEWSQIDDSTLLCMYYNSDGIAYKEGISKFNAFNQITYERQRLLISNKFTKWEYAYDDFGKLISVVESSNIGGNTTNKSEFFYDENGAVYEEKIYRNAVLEKRKQYVYDPNTSLLKAQLLKTERSESIEIVQFTYNFGETSATH